MDKEKYIYSTTHSGNWYWGISTQFSTSIVQILGSDSKDSTSQGITELIQQAWVRNSPLTEEELREIERAKAFVKLMKLKELGLIYRTARGPQATDPSEWIKKFLIWGLPEQLSQKEFDSLILPDIHKFSSNLYSAIAARRKSRYNGSKGTKETISALFDRV